MGEFRMPSLGADMQAGTLVEWLKHPGDPVERGEIIAVVETQKGAIEVEVFENGTLDRLLVEEGAKVPVGTPLAVIRGAGETEAEQEKVPAEAATAATPPPPPQPSTSAPPQTAPPPPPSGRTRASPAARRRAAERGIDLEKLTGSGPGGAIVSTDVENAGTAPTDARAPSKPSGRKARGLDLGEMRQAIAAAMARSKREIPHYYLAHDVDLTAASAFLEDANANRAPQERLLLAVLFLKATATALTRHRQFNGTFENGEFTASDAVHLGTAVAIRGGGLIAPAIHEADGKSLDQLMRDLRDLVARVRTGTLRSSELSDSTVTVSSLGERGVDALFGVIYPPQVALVGFGTPRTTPWVVDDTVAPRLTVSVSLAADHRVSDGHRGALFLAEIDRLLQEPEKL